MPNIREKLIELICSTEYGNGSLIGNNFQKGFIEKIADHLIANGVTIQKWIPVSERLPEADKNVLVCTIHGTFKVAGCNFYKNGTEASWATNDGLGERAITHWMPLPEPPKED